MPPCARKLRSGLIASARRGEAAAFLDELPAPAMRALLDDWLVWARDEQLPPGDADWTVWLLLGGRGAGKTRAGAEWVKGIALGRAPFAERPVGRIAIVGETFQDAREVMVEGVSGILAVHDPAMRPSWQSSRRRLSWDNGAVAQVFSAQDPESLRGPQFDAAWCDEIAKWPHAEATWDMLQFGLRLGERPRQAVTTTPRPMPLLKRLIGSDRTRVSRMATRDNAGNLAPGFLKDIVDRYAGTRLGRQELDGELIEDRPDALWQRAAIEEQRLAAAPPLSRIVVAVDPPATSGARSAACGIVAAGVDAEGAGYVIADGTVAKAPPRVWAERAVSLYRELGADRLVAETNQGGDMVAAVIAEADRGVPVARVTASRGKWVRAEPVALLYAQGRVRHVGIFPELEDEMCNLRPDGRAGGVSPDRVDALVWALTELMLTRGGAPRVRRM